MAAKQFTALVHMSGETTTITSVPEEPTNLKELRVQKKVLKTKMKETNSRIQAEICNKTPKRFKRCVVPTTGEIQVINEDTGECDTMETNLFAKCDDIKQKVCHDAFGINPAEYVMCRQSLAEQRVGDENPWAGSFVLRKRGVPPSSSSAPVAEKRSTENEDSSSSSSS